MSEPFRIRKTASAISITATTATTAIIPITAQDAGKDSCGKKLKKRSRAGRDKHRARGVALSYVQAKANEEQEEQLKAVQREAAAARAAAQRSEQQRQWAVKAGTADFMAMVHMERELKETEDAALYALEAYEQADKQRTELYYQAKSSNSLAAKTVMESLDSCSEPCKALAKQRKVQVVEQAKALRLTVKPHLTAAIQGHAPLPHPQEKL